MTDALYTLLLLLALDCLRKQDLGGWVVLMALASLVLYAGPVMFVLTAAAAMVWQPPLRGRIVRATLAGGAVLGGLGVFYVVWGWLDGSLSAWVATLRSEYLTEYFAPGSRWRDNLLFVGYLALGCGGLTLLGLWHSLSSKDDQHAFHRTAASLVAGYFLILMGSRYKNLHYLGPLLPVLSVLSLRAAVNGWSGPRLWRGGASPRWLGWDSPRASCYAGRRRGPCSPSTVNSAR